MKLPASLLPVGPETLNRRVRIGKIGRGEEIDVGGHPAVNALEVERAQTDLLHVIDTLSPSSGLASRLNGGQQQRDQHCNNGDHDQQFDEREGSSFPRTFDSWKPLEEVADGISELIKTSQPHSWGGDETKATQPRSPGPLDGRRPFFSSAGEGPSWSSNAGRLLVSGLSSALNNGLSANA